MSGGGGSLTVGGSGYTHGTSYVAPSGRAGEGGEAANIGVAVFSAGGGGGKYGGGAVYTTSCCGGGGGGTSLISNLVDARGETSSVPGVAGGVTSPFWTQWIDSTLRTPGNRDSDGLVTISAPAPVDAAGARYVGLASPLSTWDQVRCASSVRLHHVCA